MFLVLYQPPGVALTIRLINNNPKPLVPSSFFKINLQNILDKDIDINKPTKYSRQRY